MTRTIRDAAARALLAATILALLPQSGIAQAAGNGFLFKQPRVAVKFETGYAFQRAQSDLFDFVLERHTLNRRDFDSPYIGGEIAIRVSEHWDVAVGVGHQESSVRSEFREYIDTDDFPIEQVTRLRLLPVMVGAKYFFRERGRAIGRFAWIPATVEPFVGVAVGLLAHRFEQDGDFLDFDTLSIFADRLVSRDETFSARASAGLNVSLSELFVVTGEARYGWARGKLNENVFSGFDKMDLAGLQLVVGISFRY